MAKTITKYRGFTATQLKTRADIPEQANMTVSGNDLICTNIQVSDIKTELNSAYTDVWNLCREDKVNVWSGFGPTVRSVSGSDFSAVLVNSKPTGATMGDFAGYNHTATTPGWTTGGKANAEADVWINSGSYATVISDITIGEVKYEGADGIVLVAFDGSSNIMAYGETAISSLSEVANLDAQSIDTITLDKTWTLKSYLKVGTIAAWDDIISAVLYRCPNVDDATVHIKVKTATVLYYSLPSPWVQEGSEGMNWTTGYFDIGMIACNQNKTIKIFAQLFDWTSTEIGIGYIVGDADNYYSYSAMEDLTGSVYLGMTNIPAYGYSVSVSFEESL